METKEPIKVKFTTLVIVVVVLIILLLTGITVINNFEDDQQKIEHYYLSDNYLIQSYSNSDIEQEKNKQIMNVLINNFDNSGKISNELNNIKQKYEMKTNQSTEQIINNYSEYINKFKDEKEVLNLLENVVDSNFFNNKSLIVIIDETYSARGIEGYISKINIKNNEANITIKRNEREYGDVALQTRTYFIPIDNKNITDIKIKYEFSFDLWEDLLEPIWKFSPLIILVIGVLIFSVDKRKIKKSAINEEEKSKKSKHALKKLFAWIISSGVLWIILFISEKMYYISVPIA